MRVCGYCRTPFVICRPCDRGHVYCGVPCRIAGYALKRRESRARHQKTLEGRLDHRDRQRAYRCRQVSRVTDQTSLSESRRVELPSAPPHAAVAQKEVEHVFPKAGRKVRCCICGRRGYWVQWDSWWERPRFRCE